jgi:serine/threonine protein kinase
VYLGDLENSVFKQNTGASNESRLNSLIEFIGEDFSEITNLLASCLEINPFFRITAHEAIRDPIFETVRKPDIEKGLEWMKMNQKELLIELDVDTYDSFDYTSKITGKHTL